MLKEENSSEGIMQNPPMRAASAGQGGLLAIAIAVIVSLIIIGSSLSSLSNMNATHSVVVKQSLQTYYAAQAGLHEALATRMLPRSNYMNFDNSSDPSNGGKPVSNKSMFPKSGNIYQDISNTNKGLIAKYRYVVLGGDSARKPDKSYYSPNDKLNGIPRLLVSDTIPASSPFIVISNGLTCTSQNGKSTSIPDALSNGINPTCANGTERDEVTLVALVRLAQESGAPDKVEQIRMYKDSSKIQLPAATVVPGYGWRSANAIVNFDTVWSYQGTPIDDRSMLALERVVFYDFTTNQIYQDIDINAPTTTVGPRIPGNAAIRLYFNGPIDYRSISPTTDLSDLDLRNCKPTPSNPYQADNCNIRVIPNPPMTAFNHAYPSNTTIPLFPGSTQVILLPPLAALSSGVPHELQVDTRYMRSFNNARTNVLHRVYFTTK